MSASLVGSEMCIRDRPQPLPPLQPWQHQPQQGGSPCRGAPSGNSSCNACLLYTSDAADDM
eukprot:14542915-Alexandrium_andersonii.AAC.1